MPEMIPRRRARRLASGKTPLRAGSVDATLTRLIRERIMTDHGSRLRAALIVGLIGYAGVAVFYALFDLIAARGWLFTVNMLGISLFRGAPDPAMLHFPVEPSWPGIFWYNAIHLGVSLAIGVFVLWLLPLASGSPRRARIVQLVLSGGYVATVLAVGILSRTIRPVLPWWSIATVNALAVLLAGGFLLARRRSLVAPVLR